MSSLGTPGRATGSSEGFAVVIVGNGGTSFRPPNTPATPMFANPAPRSAALPSNTSEVDVNEANHHLSEVRSGQGDQGPFTLVSLLRPSDENYGVDSE